MSIADMKLTKALESCQTNNLKVFPLDRQALESILPLDGRFKMEDYTENFPENCQSWTNPNDIQVLLTLESASPLD